MSKFRKKIVVPITLILVGCCVAVTFILHDSLTKVDANVAFNGISNIIDAHGGNSPFNIVEVVPSKDQASIGYLIDGQEPQNWKKTISTITNDSGTGKDARAKYITTLKDKLANITTYQKDNSKPLYYEDYEESYIDGGEGWSQIDLANVETLPADTEGYKMEYAVGGSFEFDTEYVTAVTDGNPSGKYDQNIDHYVFISGETSDDTTDDTSDDNQRGYYGIVFKQVEISAGSNAYDYFNPTDDTGDTDRTAYKVKSAYAIVTEKSMTAIAKYDPHAAIYSVDNSNTDSPYIYVGQAENYNGDAEENSLRVLDFEKYTYYTLEMEYVPSEEVQNDVTYYEVDDEKPVLFFEDKSGEYGAVLDADEPYIKVYDESADYPQMGHFDIKEDSQVYNYVGKGNGSYNIVVDDTAKLDYPLNISRIYIKGGFKNNDWFRNGVFNQDSSDKSNDMTFNVQTITPAEMNNINWSDIDLLYISGGDGSTSYSTEDDITGQTVFAVAKRAHETGFMMPVIVDYGLVADHVSTSWDFGNTTSIQRLAALLCCTNYDDLNIESIDPNNYNNSWAVNWSGVKFDKKLSSTSYQNGYVNGNIYVIPKNDSDSVAFLLKDFATALTATTDDDSLFQNDADSIGFGEIAEYINAENKIRKTENEANTGTTYDYFDRKISKDIILSYIISYANKRDIANPTDSLNILDIEPGAVSDNSSNALSLDMIKKWLGSNYPGADKVTIVRMTSSEFIGKIEDLNNYDMIYMGLICDNNNKVNGVTVYNDEYMNGLIYTNVGDVAVIDSSNYMNGHAGLLENDYSHDGNGNRLALDTTLTERTTVTGRNEKYNSLYATAINTYRYSGNDITLEKKKALENYVSAGFPIVLGYGIITNSKVNEDYIDNCSNIYDFFNDVKDKANVISVDSSNNVSGELYSTLTTAKPKITVKSMTTDAEHGYVELSDNKIEIEFTITNTGGVDDNALFDVSFLLDANSDGKFSNTQEQIAANDFKLYRNGTLVSTQISDDGKYYFAVSAGNATYKLMYDLPDGYVGVIPWKLEVSQATNEYRYDSQSGYFYKKRSADEIENINILQIDTAGKSTFNMTTNDTFKKLINQVDDFSLNITYKNAKDYANEYKDGYLDNYDMIIMGFGDMYSISNTNGCLDAIKAYIQSGKPVLFTHDTTSFSNDSVGKNIWGYDFNKIIRNEVGMDRYGILENEGLQSGATLTASDNTSVLANGKYKTISELYSEATLYANANSTDIAYEPRSNRSIIVRQNQGFTYLNLSRYMPYTTKQSNNRNYYYLDTRYNKYQCYTGLSLLNSYTTTRAEQVNSGQITTYPFKINTSLNVSTTHRQYYQLDLNQDVDRDGESDIVVWYTLSGTGYDKSPRDVRNNYYIYTMGNVTYSGVGHSEVNSEEEMKLYINTMIAAYNSGVHAPKVSVTESAADDARDLSTIYVTIDEAVEAAGDGNNAVVDAADDTDPTQDIYFSIKDTNIVRMHKSTAVYADFCLAIDENEYNNGINGVEGRNKDDYIVLDDNDNKIFLKKVDINVTAADANSAYNDVQMSALASGIKYKAQIPLSLLPSGKNSITLYVLGHSRITKYANDGVSDGETKTTSYSYKTIQIQRIGLADLD